MYCSNNILELYVCCALNYRNRILLPYYFRLFSLQSVFFSAKLTMVKSRIKKSQVNQVKSKLRNVIYMSSLSSILEMGNVKRIHI